MKNLLIPTSLLVGLVAFKLWRFRVKERKDIDKCFRNLVKERKDIDKCFRNLDRYHNPSREKQYRIKKAVNEVEVGVLLKKNDICIVESRNLSGELKTLVFFKDSQDFLIVNSRLNWEIRDPLKMILNSGDMSYKKTTEWLTDILGNTIVAH